MNKAAIAFFLVLVLILVNSNNVSADKLENAKSLCEKYVKKMKESGGIDSKGVDTFDKTFSDKALGKWYSTRTLNDKNANPIFKFKSENLVFIQDKEFHWSASGQLLQIYEFNADPNVPCALFEKKGDVLISVSSGSDSFPDFLINERDIPKFFPANGACITLVNNKPDYCFEINANRTSAGVFEEITCLFPFDSKVSTKWEKNAKCSDKGSLARCKVDSEEMDGSFVVYYNLDKAKITDLKKIAGRCKFKKR